VEQTYQLAEKLVEINDKFDSQRKTANDIFQKYIAEAKSPGEIAQIKKELKEKLDEIDRECEDQKELLKIEM
jgi:hypothetical protein